MQLPAAWREAIIDHAAQFAGRDLQAAAGQISAAYREGQMPLRRAEVWYVAYGLVRVPATYAAARRALAIADLPAPATVLDLGAGPGVFSLAATQHFSQPLETQLIDSDPRWREFGERWSGAPSHYRVTDLRRVELTPHDCVSFCYSLGEIADWEPLLARAWQAATQALVIIEPGTPERFARLLDVRTWLLNHGAYLAAPCPGAYPCPLRDPDWCHFGARVERTALHRRLKQGELSYEDEKFCFLAATREPRVNPPSRIIRRPSRDPGLIQLTLCRDGQSVLHRVPKRHHDEFRVARKAEWGDAYRTVNSH